MATRKAGRGGRPWPSWSCRNVSVKVAPAISRWTATTRAASVARAGGGEAADDVLGQHGQPLLGFLVAGQADVEEPQRLGAPVDAGDDVGADLVLHQGVGPGLGDLHSGADEEAALRHQHPGHVVADLDGLGEHGGPPLRSGAAPGGPGRRRRRRRGTGRAPTRSRRRRRPGPKAGEDGLGQFEQVVVRPAVELEAGGQERVGAPVLEHARPGGPGPGAGPGTCRQRGVLDPLEGDGVQRPLEQVGIDGQGPVVERRVLAEAAVAELGPGVRRR